MPRPLRIEFENAWYHVMNRGANKQNIFESSTHKNLFYTLLNEISERFKIEIHAFCLMSNHYHLLIKTPHANLGKAMRHLDGIYTQRFNRMSHRDGPLFRGRYKAILVDSDQYLLQVSRYIHLNPVTANICSNPLEYKWSSYRSFVNTTLSIPWLYTSFTLNQMPEYDKPFAYASFVNQGIDQETNEFYKKNHLSSIYGNKEFTAKHLNMLDQSYVQSVLPDINHTKPLPKIEMIFDTVKDYFHLSKNEIIKSTQGKKNIPKLISIYLLSKLAHLSHKKIASIFSTLKESSIPHQIIRLKNQIQQHEEVSRYVNEITNLIEKSNHDKHDH